MKVVKSMVAFGLVLLTWAGASASDWPHWRGPGQNGVSPETGLISNWSPEGENLVWQADFVGRSTPIVLNGRVYVIGRSGQDITEQERVACFDAETGLLVWDHAFNVFHTTIPFNRVGWASLAGDPETGNIYAHGVQGTFVCYNSEGKILWTRSLTEEVGRISGYGGRTHTPFVDGDLVVISFLSTSWGSHRPGRHRYYALNKNTGETVWISTPGGPPKDTTYSTPVIAVINGQRVLVAGNADGAIYALKIGTGEMVWKFQFSKRGINSSVVVDGTRVYASHSEENMDNTSMGRVVCIDGTGTGDVTKTHEVWRYDESTVGYTSPIVHDGSIYFVDNSANLHCLDAGSGKEVWVHNVGTVGRGAPVWADGKIYANDVNGTFEIIRAGSEAESLDKDLLTMAEGRPAEIYGSPAFGYKRIYFTTEGGLYCLGDPMSRFVLTPSAHRPYDNSADEGAEPTHVQVIPAEVLVQPGKPAYFVVRTFDENGRLIGEPEAEWSLKGLAGKVEGGAFTADQTAGSQAGVLVAKVGELEGSARVRVVAPLDWSQDFEKVEEGTNPSHWVGASTKFLVRAQKENKVLVKAPVTRGLNRSNVYLGPHDWSNYTIQVDLMGTKKGRRRPDMGLVANRYILDMMGNHQRLQVRSWTSDLRMAKTIDFAWESDVWYTMKFTVELVGGKALIRGKVWKTSEEEPDAWTITAEDPLPNREGSPGLYGFSAAEIYYDNLKVTKNSE